MGAKLYFMLDYWEIGKLGYWRYDSLHELEFDKAFPFSQLFYYICTIQTFYSIIRLFPSGCHHFYKGS